MIFAAVVKAKSFSEAARRLKMPLASVSRRVADLEAELGVRLLERSTRSLRLTEVGAEVLEYAERSLEICEAVDSIGSKDLPRSADLTAGCLDEPDSEGIFARQAAAPRLPRLFQRREIHFQSAPVLRSERTAMMAVLSRSLEIPALRAGVDGTSTVGVDHEDGSYRTGKHR
jgi:DNA-binding transcriptional LysR family regulator